MTYEDSVTPPIPEPAYLHLFDALPGNYLLLKTDEPYFTILAATSKRQEVVGVPKEAVIGKPLFEAHPGNLTDPTDDGVNNLRASLQHVIRFKEIHHLPVQRYDLPNEAGGFSEKYWEASNRPVFDELGEVAFIIHTAEDITDKVKAQKREVQMQGIERYAAALQQFKFMADNAPDPFILMRADGTFAYLNPKALEAWGYTEEEARHLLVKNVDPLYQDEKYAQLFAKAQKKTSLQIDTFHKRKDGHIYPVELNVNSLLLGNERHLFGVARNVTERRKAAEQLLSSHERIANILESTTDAFYALDNNFNFTYINAKAAQLWDRDREKLIGKNFWTEFSQAATSDSYLKHYEARNEAQPVHFEAISPILNTWIEASIYPGKDGSLSVFFHDITERKKSETALLESEAKFRTLFESMDQGYCTLEVIFEDGQCVNYRYLETNPTFERHLGMENALGKTILEIAPDIEPKWFDFYGGVALTGNPIRLEEESKAFNKWFEVYAIRVGRAEDRKVGVFFTDITGRKKVEEALRISESNLMNLILQAPVAICIFKGPEMLLDIANERMIEFFGRSAEELLKKPIFEALPEARNQGFEELLVNVMQTGNPVSASESPVTLHRNGELQEVFVNFVYAPVRENDGTINSIIALAIDVTEQVHARHKIEEIVDQRTKELALVNEDLIQLNKELKRSNANLEEFAYAASHDLKEPVRKIHLFTSQLREQLNTLITAEQAKYFNRIENSTVRMKNLIDDLLLYSHVTFQPDIKEDVDLNEKADRVIEDLDLEIEEKAARIKIEKLPVVRGYPRQLQQMFQNLISNSLKYSKSDEQPRVDISAREVLVDGINYHLIAIKDNGIGFEAEYFDTIFHIFTRLHRQTQYSGTGVGLSIVKKVVENHNGFIRVESTPGTGSTFNIYLLKNTKD